MPLARTARRAATVIPFSEMAQSCFDRLPGKSLGETSPTLERVVCGEAILGANIVRDIFGGIIHIGGEEIRGL
jgi:uncharacterized protein YbjQ (UPF0145 family)